MADIVWAGTTSTWTTGANWVGAAAPTDNDSVFFTGGSNQSVDGLTLGASDNDFAEFMVHEDYTGDIGASGTPVVSGNVTRLEYAARSGRLYWDSGAGTVTTAVVRCLSARSDAVYLDGTVTTLRIQNASGGMTIPTGAAVTTIELTSSPNFLLTIQSGVTGLTNVKINGGGTIDCSSAIDTGVGRLILSGPNSRMIRQGSGANTLVEIYGRDSAIFDDRGSGTVSTLYMSGPGTLYDGRSNKNTSVTITAGTASHGARLQLDNAMDSYTATITQDGTATINGGNAVEVAY